MRDGKPGRVTETVGRRVRVEDAEGERVCFLSGHRAVVGDRVNWVEAKGTGGKIVGVLPRDSRLVRRDFNGREQVLAANLEGLLIVAAAQEPPFRPGLIDRYVVAAGVYGLDAVVVLTKTDLGVPDGVREALALRDLHVVEVSNTEGTGLDGVRAVLADGTAPWAMVGHSGVGKTSLIGALLPDEDVGPVAELSEYWGTGQHTTTRSKIFPLSSGGEIADSPGIRTFTPGGVEAIEIRRFFPGLQTLVCKYRDCMHRPDEDGCLAEEHVSAPLLVSYRRLLDEVLGIEAGNRP